MTDEIRAFVEQTEAVCSNVTHGEWSWDGDVLITPDPLYLVLKPYYDDDKGEVSTCIFSADKQFIAAARAALPRALEIIKEQAARIEELERGNENDL